MSKRDEDDDSMDAEDDIDIDEGKSQIRNKTFFLKILRARVLLFTLLLKHFFSTDL